MIRALVAGTAMTVAFAAVASAQEAVRIGTDVDANSLDPRLTRDTTAYRVVNLVYDGLIELSASLEPQPGLAESWENPDPTTWIFHLRDGVTFQDGTPFSADDVVFTYNTTRDPALASRWLSLYAPIQAVEAVDPQTVKITLSQPYAPLLTYLDLGIVPQELVEAGHDLGANPVGTGPYKLAEWARGSHILLEPNAEYWGGPANAALDFVIVADNTSRAQALEAGDLDLIQSPLSPADIRRLDDDPAVAGEVMGGLGVTYINFNTKVPLLADPGIRRALSLLIDRETIVNELYEGVDVAATSVLLPSWPAYSPDIQQPSFDPEAAATLLASLGWKDTNGDSVLDKDGQPLTVTLSTHSEDPNRVQAIEYIQNVMRSAGVDAQVAISDWPSFSTGVQNGQHQVALLGWLNLVDPDRLLYGQLHTGGATNWGGYSNPAVDEALDRGRAALDPAERIAAYQDAAKIIAEDVPYYIISYQGYQVFHDPALAGYEANPRGLMRSLAGL